MANRSYLYTHHPGEDPEYRDFSEWNYTLPISHLLLVGANPTVCASALWDVEEKIAIKGDAGQSRPLFTSFLDWLENQLPEDYTEISKEAKEFLARPDRQGIHFHLELGEIYELRGLKLDEMAKETLSNAVLAKELFLEVQRLVETPGSTLDDSVHEKIKALKDDWEKYLGAYFAPILYWHLGG